MRTTRQMSVTLPNEMAKLVKDKVASGEYASESEVIRDGLRVLVARDHAMKHWLETELLEAYDEVKAHPDRVRTIDQVRATLAQDYAELVKQRK